ncbi:MAG: WD40 repeat domain-containing serine/threonine protein kinase [Pirellula sp.]
MSEDRSRSDDLQQESDDDSPLAQALAEYAELHERSAAPSREEFVARYPNIATPLDECIRQLDWIKKVAMGLVDDPLGNRSESTLKVLGDYRIVRQLGRGGMGVVYEAEQISLRRRVALKVLPLAGMLDEKALARFRNEAQAAACLHHPHIVPIFGVGCERGVHYLAMQFVDGASLDHVILEMREAELRERPCAMGAMGTNQGSEDTKQKTSLIASLSTERNSNVANYFRRVAKLIAQAADALHHAHECGVIHRDIKPSNLILDSRGTIWITDFGLARMEGSENHTLSGDLLGTLRYMSPEQASGRRIGVDHRTDIYSLGATLYELLCLTPVIPGDDREHLLRQLLHEDPQIPRRLDARIPLDLSTIAFKAISKDPSDRYATADDLANDLRRFLDHQPIRARPLSLSSRFYRWTKRNFIIARVLGIAVVITCLTGITAAWMIERAQLDAKHSQRNAEVSQRERDFHLKSAEEANDKVNEQRYASKISLAAHAWRQNRLEVMQSSLSELIPREGEVDHRGFEWRYLDSIRRRRPEHFDRQEGPVYCTRFSPDGKYFATGGGAGVRVYSSSDLSLVWKMHTHVGDVNGVDWSHNGKRLAAVGDDGQLVIYEAEKGRALKAISFEGALVSARFTTDGKRLVLAERTKEIDGKVVGANRLQVMKTEEWNTIAELKGSQRSLQGLDVSADGRWAVAVSDAGEALVYDLSTLMLRHCLKRVTPRIDEQFKAVAFKHLEAQFAVVTRAGGILIYDAESGQQIADFADESSPLEGVAFEHNDKSLISVSRYGLATIWRQVPGGSWRVAKQFSHDAQLWSVAIRLDGTFLVSGQSGKCWRHSAGSCYDKIVLKASPEISDAWLASSKGFRSNSYQEFCAVNRNESVKRKPSALHLIAWSPDGTEFAVSGGESRFELWNSIARQPTAVVATNSNITALTYSEDGEYIVIGTAEGKVIIYRRKGLALVKERVIPEFKKKSIALLAFSPHGDRLMVTDTTGWIPNAELAFPSLAMIESGENTFPSAKLVLFPKNDIDLRNWLTARIQPEFARQTNMINSRFVLWTFSPKGDCFAMQTSDEFFHVYAAPDWKQKAVFVGNHDDRTMSIVLSPDGRTLASLTHGGVVKLWSVSTGRLLMNLEPQLLYPPTISFSPDGRFLAAIGQGLDDQAEIVLWQGE